MGDMFDTSLHLEESFIKEGRQEGLRIGRAEGQKEGICLGVDKGFEIGSELGFYEGTVETFLALLRTQPGVFNQRTERALQSMKSTIATFPQNPQDDRLQDVMADLRGKFRAIVAMTDLKDNYFPEREISAQSTAF